ncbi:MAG: LCP family protein [Acutalibacteraceae bacterium]
MRIIENDNIQNDNSDFSAENDSDKIESTDAFEEISSFYRNDITGFENEEEIKELKIEDFYSDSSLIPDDKKDNNSETGEENSGDLLQQNISDDNEITSREEPEKEEKLGFFASLWKNKSRRARLAYAFVSFILVIVGAAYGFINAMLDKVEADDNNPNIKNELGEEIIYDDEDFDLFSAVSSAGSVNEYIDQWYESGESMYSKNVINVLLVGLDSKDGLKTGDSRSDTMMVVSLNTKTKKISMVSLFRDTWAKFVPSDGVVHFGKMNGSYRYGGINCTVQTIEKMFKIKINHYAIVDFRNFKKLVDAVGGVDLYVQEYEAKNMKREWNIDVDFSKDENDLVHLNGEQAFWFARQRHSDSNADVSRTRRQRQVITAFINSCKGASFSQLSDALNSVFSLIKTDLTKTEILGYAAKALAWGWLNYPIETIQISDSSIFQTPTLFGASIVLQDYPKVAQIIQEGLYGSSNIVLEEGRKIIFSLY